MYVDGFQLAGGEFAPVAALAACLAALALCLNPSSANAQEAPGPVVGTTADAPSGANADTARATAAANPAPDAPVGEVVVETGNRPHASGSMTLRYATREGEANDRWSQRYGMEWGAGHWSGGFDLQLESARLDGALHHEPGIGSLDVPERWVGWTHQGPRALVDTRLGTTHGLRFGEGLVLGAATFDGLEVVTETKRTRTTVLTGRTDVIDPEDFFIEPITLFPRDEEFLGARGSLHGVRAEVRPTQSLSLGWSLLDATAEKSPRARLAGMDVSWAKGPLSLVAESAVRDHGGDAHYLRADVAFEKWDFGVERRRYRDFASPLGNPALYSGLTAGDDREEDGWLVRVGFQPTKRVSGTWSLDTTEGAKGGDASAPIRRRDHRLALDFVLAKRTALAYGVEMEEASEGHDGSTHSLLLTHAFEGGARLAGRYSWDRTSPEGRQTLRLSCRVPLLNRRLTLLFDDSLRRERGVTTSTLVMGASVRVGESSFVTVRATAADGEDDGVDVTWYRRF